MAGIVIVIVIIIVIVIVLVILLEMEIIAQVARQEGLGGIRALAYILGQEDFISRCITGIPGATT